MKNFKIAGSIIGLLFVLFFSLFIFELNKYFRFKKEKIEKTEKVQAARAAEKEWEKLQTKIIEMDLKASQIKKRIPYDEKKPLELIKQISLLGARFKIKNLEFIYKGGKKGQASSSSSTTSDLSSANNANSGFSSPGTENISSPAFSGAAAEIKMHVIEVNFESEFMPLTSFLKEILTLDRLISIEKIKIQRQEPIRSHQKVNMDIITYTFSSQ